MSLVRESISTLVKGFLLCAFACWMRHQRGKPLAPWQSSFLNPELSFPGQFH
ncbi:uncharacterized protein P174DRAFT_446335 [Aspergillus novofumigatus IBT 16806]|uniref:Uncharacterized protein n=1 Tax=Aspergillus novofumigatus (strain IBT 16806) TaxID=1392255 RepID=A0A2I1BSZ4_ASPN1|nr:uncharacterized protein P174DRAFT_446335 [Aspergillus novofumigatus IBT 16806]PKX88499.1 hypothetical protein P174DRAFT_446335 [Aspergillus novofumigatus IBT 16806]